MYCKKCGTEQRDGDRFCRKCGNPYPLLNDGDDISKTVETVAHQTKMDASDEDRNIDESKINQDSCFFNNTVDADESDKDWDLLIKDSKPIENSKKDDVITEKNNNEDSNSQQPNTFDNPLTIKRKSRFQERFNKIDKITKVIAVVSCVIFFIFKGGFSASFWWWAIIGIILSIAFVKTDAKNKKETMDQAQGGLFICCILSAILLIWGPNNYSDTLDNYRHETKQSNNIPNNEALAWKKKSHDRLSRYIGTWVLTKMDGFTQYRIMKLRINTNYSADLTLYGAYGRELNTLHYDDCRVDGDILLLLKDGATLNQTPKLKLGWTTIDSMDGYHFHRAN